MKCPRCGCNKLVKWGVVMGAKHAIIPRWKCTGCKKPITKPIID